MTQDALVDMPRGTLVKKLADEMKIYMGVGDIALVLGLLQPHYRGDPLEMGARSALWDYRDQFRACAPRAHPRTYSTHDTPSD